MTNAQSRITDIVSLWFLPSELWYSTGTCVMSLIVLSILRCIIVHRACTSWSTVRATARCPSDIIWHLAIWCCRMNHELLESEQFWCVQTRIRTERKVVYYMALRKMLKARKEHLVKWWHVRIILILLSGAAYMKKGHRKMRYCATFPKLYMQ